MTPNNITGPLKNIAETSVSVIIFVKGMRLMTSRMPSENTDGGPSVM